MLGPRARRTLAAVARTLVPPGGAVQEGADELGLIDKLVLEIETYPKRARRRMRILLFATEYLPLASGHWRRFSALDPSAQREVLERNGRHPRSPLRRLVVSYLKQLVYSSYISQAPVERAVGYTYECARPRDVGAEEGVHH